MSVASKNPFEALRNEGIDDDGDAPKAASSTAAPSSTATRGGASSRANRGARRSDYPQRGGGRRVAVTGTTEDRPPRDVPGSGRDRRGGGAGGFNADANEAIGEERGKDRQFKRGGRGGGARGGGGGRFPRAGTDRMDRTGREDSEKKEHQAWGGDDGKRELAAETDGVNDAEAEKTNGAWGVGEDGTQPYGEGAGNDGSGAPEQPGYEEEVDNTKTLEEYLAERKNALPTLTANPRQANEGVDESQWKDAVQLLRENEEEEAYFIGNKGASGPRVRTKKEGKIHLDIEQRFNDPPNKRGRGRGEGRGRGGGGGGRGRGGDRPPRGGGYGGARGGSGNVNVDDESAFPALS